MRLLLIRHGQSRSDVEFLLDTAAPGAPLTALGERQAAALPQALAEEDVRAVHASPLTRARRTAAPPAAARGPDVLVRDGVREIFAGDLETLPGRSERARLSMRTVFARAAGETELRVPGGESGTEALARYDAVVSEAAGSAVPTAAVVGHGAAIRRWTAARADDVDVASTAARPLDNTGVVVLEGSPEDGWNALSRAGAAVVPCGASGPAGQALDEDVSGG